MSHISRANTYSLREVENTFYLEDGNGKRLATFMPHSSHLESRKAIFNLISASLDLLNQVMESYRSQDDEPSYPQLSHNLDWYHRELGKIR